MKKWVLVFVVMLLSITSAIQAEAALIDLTDYSWDLGYIHADPTYFLLYRAYNRLYGTSYTTNDQIEFLENDTIIGSGIFPLSYNNLGVVQRVTDSALTLDASDSAGFHNIVTNLPNGAYFVNPPILSFAVTAAEPYGLRGNAYEHFWPGVLLYSDHSLNPNSRYHFIVFNTPDPNQFLLGFEDCPYGDWDYNDAIFIYQSSSVVPEPASMSLLGLGLFGLIGFRRKKA